MTRVRMLQNEEAPLESRELLEKIEKNGAEVLNLYRTIAHSPSTLSSFLKLGNVLLDQTELSPKFRELAILRIAILMGSEYEWEQHVPIALEVGINQEQIDDIHEWPESDNFDKAEKAVLAYTDQVTLNIKASDRVFRSIRKHLSERSIVELTITIGYWGMIARVLGPLEVDVDKQSAGSIKKLMGKK